MKFKFIGNAGGICTGVEIREFDWKPSENVNYIVQDIMRIDALQNVGNNYDLIIIRDVMEHIPKEQIPETFQTIFSKAEKFVFLAICTQPAIAVLPNGENAHCTVESIGWWVNMVEKYAPKRVYTHLKTYGYCNNYEILNEDLYLEWFLTSIK